MSLPVLAFISWLFCLGSPVKAVLFCLSCSCCPFLAAYRRTSTKLRARKSRSTNIRARKIEVRWSAKFEAKKRARKRQREELPPGARSLKKSACPALVFTQKKHAKFEPSMTARFLVLTFFGRHRAVRFLLRRHCGLYPAPLLKLK